MNNHFSLPGIKALAYVNALELPSDLGLVGISGLPLTLMVQSVAIPFTGEATCTGTRSNANGGANETVELTFLSLLALPEHMPLAFLVTDVKYNNGSLYGMWIDLSTFDEYADFIKFCNRLHADEADAELMFQDYEHYPSSWYHESCMGEETFDKIKEYANLSEEKREAYEAYLSNWDEGTLEDFEERFEGKYDSPEDFAEYLCEECGYFKNLPQWLQCCIHYSAVWRSLDTGGDYTEVDGYIFRA